MANPLHHRGSIALFVVLVLGVCAVQSSQIRPKFKVLHAFGNGTDGAGLFGGVVRAANGKLYGTTSGGGLYQYGTVWELTPHASGKWTEKVLHNFKNNDPNGDDLNCTLTVDSAGDLFGTTTMGGGAGVAGTVFEMQPSSKGLTLKVIHRFGKNDPANGPFGGVIMDESGNLYGVGGWAFELSPASDGWKETLIHEFNCQNGDGCGVLDRPILDSAGNLYGSTEHGGTSKNCGDGCGTVYKLHPLSDRSWKETILHSFGAPKDGSFPLAGVTMDALGNLYGTTGGYNSGTVYELTPQSDGHWKETILHRFRAGSGGNYPASIVMDAKGNLYGGTGYGGGQCNCGVIYELSQQANGTWKYTVLHTFSGYDGTGGGPIIFDDKGNMYGTGGGGAYGLGVVFEFTP
jgi:uncharacterized repeat protein (TIGR03803 family)